MPAPAFAPIPARAFDEPARFIPGGPVGALHAELAGRIGTVPAEPTIWRFEAAPAPRYPAWQAARAIITPVVAPAIAVIGGLAGGGALVAALLA